MLFSNPRVLPALLVCIGLTIMILRGNELKNLEQWTPQDLERAVELNYALDQMRAGQAEPLSPDQEAQRKIEIRAEITSTFVEPQRKAREEFEQAKWITGAGVVLMLIVLVLQHRGILRK